MIRLVLQPHLEPLHAMDVERIVTACALSGYAIDRATAHTVWERYSEMFAAGWLVLPSDEGEIVSVCKRYCEHEPEPGYN